MEAFGPPLLAWLLLVVLLSSFPQCTALSASERAKSLRSELARWVDLRGSNADSGGEAEQLSRETAASIDFPPQRGFEAGQRVQNYELTHKLFVLGAPRRQVAAGGDRCDLVQRILPPSDSSSSSSNDGHHRELPFDNDFPELSAAHSDSFSLVETMRSFFDESCIKNGSFYMENHIFKGGHGEIWRGFRIRDTHSASFSANAHHQETSGEEQGVIMKRMNFRDKPAIALCAAREIYFGTLFSRSAPSLPFTRLLHHFVENDDFWLIFKDEGLSLQQALYVSAASSASLILKPSQLWHRLRTTELGHQSLRGLIFQIISGVAQLHERGIVHRDIKPSNILLGSSGQAGGVRVIVADFSSAVDNHTISHGLYGAEGPSVWEETLEYAPPEVLLSLYQSPPTPIPFFHPRPESYDIWSIGVLILETIIGHSQVFEVDQRTYALMSRKMKWEGRFSREHGLLLAGLADFCIYSPHEVESSSAPEGASPSSESSPKQKCSLFHFERAILKRDPLGLGFSDSLGLDLLFRLLQFDPQNRISLRDALKHPYFLSFNSRDENTSEPSESVESVKSVEPVEPIEPAKQIRPLVGANSLKISGAPRQAVDRDCIASKEVACSSGPYRSLVLEASGEAIQQSSGEAVWIQFDHDELRGGSPTTTLTSAAQLSPLYIFDYPIPVMRSEVVSSSDPASFSPPAAILASSEGAVSKSVSGQGQELDLEFEPVSEPEPVSFSTQGQTISDPLKNVIFQCPKCGRQFTGDYGACLRHVVSRRHGHRCDAQNISTLPFLSSCLSEHSLTLWDAHSGWCDLQGRRSYVEDTHSIFFHEHFNIFGVFDGHFGTAATRYASQHIPAFFELMATSSSSGVINDLLRMKLSEWSGVQSKMMPLLPGSRLKIQSDLAAIQSYIDASDKDYLSSQLGLLAKLSEKSASGAESTTTAIDSRVDRRLAETPLIPPQQELVPSLRLSARAAAHAMHMAFLLTDMQFLQSERPGDRSGSTASVVVQFPRHLLVSHVGDSRVVLCCDSASHLALPLTVDHNPSQAEERNRVISRGGSIVSSSLDQPVSRVNGQLAITRSIGDALLGEVISAVPDVLLFSLPQTPLVAQPSASAGASRQLNYCERFKSRLSQELLRWVEGIPAAQSLLLSVLSWPSHQFVILASDGLWEVVSNDEAVLLTCEFLLTELETRSKAVSSRSLESKYPSIDWRDPVSFIFPNDTFHRAAKALAQEAFFRGSSDNIGVCVINLVVLVSPAEAA